MVFTGIPLTMGSSSNWRFIHVQLKETGNKDGRLETGVSGNTRDKDDVYMRVSLSYMSKVQTLIPTLTFCGEWSLMAGLDIVIFLPFFFSTFLILYFCYVKTPNPDEKLSDFYEVLSNLHVLKSP